MQYHGFVDASPSEVISNKKEVLAVAALFPAAAVSSCVDHDALRPPVRQYKKVEQPRKAAAASRLAGWLDDTKDSGMIMPGMVNVLTQAGAATYGLGLLEELSDAHVTQITPDTYRVHFGRRYINMSVAVALMYYWTTANFGILRASLRLPKASRLIAYMDRFPGPSPPNKTPGVPLPKTTGHWFIEYLDKNTTTGRQLRAEREASGISVKLTNLSWWKPDALSLWKDGKTHPHFVLTDWLAQAAIAAKFPDAYLKEFTRPSDGQAALKAMVDLRAAFASYDIWAMDESVFDRLRPAERRWTVPDEAKRVLTEHSLSAT